MQVTLNNTTYRNNNKQAFKAINPASVKRIAHNTSDRATSYLALGIGELASTSFAQRIVNWLKNKNYQEHLAAFVGCTLSAFYMLDTARSENIEKDQKLPLILNQGIVCGISTAGAYTLNHYLNKKINHIAELFHIAKIKDKKIQDKFLKFKANPEYASVVERTANKNTALKESLEKIKNKFEFTNNIKVYLKEELKKHKNDNVAKDFLKEIKNITIKQGQDKAEVLKELYLTKMQQSKAMKNAFNRHTMNKLIEQLANSKKAGNLSNMINGFKTAQALMVFALIYRFVSPVVATPLANSLSEKLENYRKKQ